MPRIRPIPTREEVKAAILEIIDRKIEKLMETRNNVDYYVEDYLRKKK